MNLNYLSRFYGIDSIIETKQLNSGNSSAAKMIMTTDKTYILRKLRDEKQAMTEYLISETYQKKEFHLKF